MNPPPSAPECPPKLPPPELALLRAYRAEHPMPTAARTRLVQRLVSEGRGPERSASPRRWVTAAVGLAAIALLAVGVSALRRDTAREHASARKDQAVMKAMPPQRDPSHTTARPKIRHAPTERVQPPAPPILAPQPGSAPPTPVPTAARPRAPALRRGGKDRSARPPEPGVAAPEPALSQLQREHTMLTRAWSALAAGKHAQALRVASQHADQFPSGTLSVERRAITAMASCNSKRPGWATLASQFLAAHGKTPLARRVREACGVAQKNSTDP